MGTGITKSLHLICKWKAERERKRELRMAYKSNPRDTHPPSRLIIPKHFHQPGTNYSNDEGGEAFSFKPQVVCAISVWLGLSQWCFPGASDRASKQGS